MVGASNLVPGTRIRRLNNAPVRHDGDYVLYWMTAYRRLQDNFSLDRAIELAAELGRPLLIFEALRCDYPWASRRLHQFVIEGMRENQSQAAAAGLNYVAWVEPGTGAGRGLIEKLCERAAAVVSDDFPAFFLPRMLRAVARRIDVAMEVVDSNGLFPNSQADRVFTTAHSFRRFLQKNLLPYLQEAPADGPAVASQLPRLGSLPDFLRGQWAPLSVEVARSPGELLSSLPIDQTVREVSLPGGSAAAAVRWRGFLASGLDNYGTERNHPDSECASGLSPYLHFGHISVHGLFRDLAARENWSTDSLGDPKQTRGGRSGWWGMTEPAESFLDELITWRELGFNMCFRDRKYDRWESLPEWARNTLADHAADPRPVVYDRDTMLLSRTHDEIWNAAQNELVSSGRMHNYLRMLWGKKVLEWSATPQEALLTLIEFNNRFALDGRDPNSWSGIFWVFGRYDRAWGPERKIFGKIRYMTSDSTRRKLKLTEYLKKWSIADR